MSGGKTVPSFSLNSFVMPKEDWYKTLTFQDSIDMAKEKMVSTAENFVALGYYLKHIRDNKLYKEKGYDNIWECANNELELTQSTASRYINICEKFSTDGNSPYLDARYKEYGKSQLQELLAINDRKLIEQITPDMSVRQIQKMKKSNRNETCGKYSKESNESLPEQKHMVVDGTFREFIPEQDVELPTDKIVPESEKPYEKTMFLLKEMPFEIKEKVRQYNAIIIKEKRLNMELEKVLEEYGVPIKSLVALSDNDKEPQTEALAHIDNGECTTEPALEDAISQIEEVFLYYANENKTDG